MTEPATPYYLIDEARLLGNLQIVDHVRERSGAKALLALKCFATWSVFDLISQHLDGTTSSSLFEARLGHERFGKETHAYSVAYSPQEIAELATFADKVIFNSISQLEAFASVVSHLPIGLRVNPGISHSGFDLADPARRFSRLGEVNPEAVAAVADRLSGLMFHFNCENTDATSLAEAIDVISRRYDDVLRRMEWVSLGGGISFTTPGFDIAGFCQTLRAFAERFDVQVYLEPGEAVITSTTELVTTVLDVVHNEVDVAIVDTSIEAHLLDHLIYSTTPTIAQPGPGQHRVMIAGRTCLAGDVLGDYSLDRELSVGDRVFVADTAGYTMVKKSWFNGIAMPSIAVRRLDGTIEVVRQFTYHDYESNLS
ncbi:MAG TPA: carboxynorspermidine decarboxylase [Ilumatobacter sp.]|nr:carboxynorspermidine decarboxylase [Ilumatobacter sp.]